MKMKKIISVLLAVGMMLVLCSCQGSFGKVNLAEPIDIPTDGIIQQSTIEQIQKENAIGTFCGESNGLRYEWTIFGSDIDEAREINLGITLGEAEGGVRLMFSQTEPFGFSALLSIYLNEVWDAQGAAAYQNETAVASVSLTGSKSTILNLSTDGSLGEVVIRPDALPEEELLPTETEAATTQPEESGDNYLSDVIDSDGQVYTDGKDKYNTDPIPEGKPKPVEPENQEVDRGKAYTCTFSIECSTILNNLDQLDPDKLEMVPSGGTILATTTVTFYEGESVFDVLQRICKEKGIHLESSWTPIYNSAYIEGIHNLYEFDCGALSGWMYRVNGWYPNYGCSRYQLQDGDVVEWRYTCDLGNDVGGKNLF